MRAKVGDFHPERCAMRSTEPVRACARQRAALPILWMGPGLTAGLGGSFRTARASGRAGVPACLPAHVHIRCPLRVECSHCLPPSSGHHLCAVWSHGDSLGGHCAARCAATDETCMRACCVRVAARVCTDCVRTCVCTCTFGCFAKSLQKRTKKYGTRPRHFSHASHVVVLIVGASLASLSAPSYHWTRP